MGSGGTGTGPRGGVRSGALQENDGSPGFPAPTGLRGKCMVGGKWGSVEGAQGWR